MYLLGGSNPIDTVFIKLDHFPQSFEVNIKNKKQTTNYIYVTCTTFPK